MKPISKANIFEAVIGLELEWRKRVLAVAVGAVVAGPIASGLFHVRFVRAQSEPAGTLSFEIALVKANRSGDTRALFMILPGGRFIATNNTVRALILNAYGILASPYLLEGGP